MGMVDSRGRDRWMCPQIPRVASASDGRSDAFVRETPTVVRTRSSREEGERRRGEACVRVRCACACARARRERARGVRVETGAVGEEAREAEEAVSGRRPSRARREGRAVVGDA